MLLFAGSGAVDNEFSVFVRRRLKGLCLKCMKNQIQIETPETICVTIGGVNAKMLAFETSHAFRPSRQCEFLSEKINGIFESTFVAETRLLVVVRSVAQKAQIESTRQPNASIEKTTGLLRMHSALEAHLKTH